MTHSMAAGYASEVAALRRELETVRAEKAHQLPADVLESELRRMYLQGVTDAPQFQSAAAREVLCQATVHGALRILRAALAAAGERGA